MIKKIIVIGTTTQNNKLVNGQSMMFQLFVDYLVKKNIKPIIIDFGLSISKNSNVKRVSGKLSVIKLIDNFILTFRFLFVILNNLGTPIYITTSQSKVGFIRDYIFINTGKILGSKIIAHQFGSNYGQFYSAQSNFIKKLIFKTLNKTDKIIVEGDFTKKQFNFLPDFEEKVASIPNGLPEKIKEDNLPKKIDINDSIKLIYLSNLIESKGFWDVLEAINILVNKNNLKVEAIFSGKFLGDVEDEKYKTSEEAKNAFFKYIEENSLSKLITYYEGLFGAEKASAFSNAHFFLLPSYYINEGQPVSILEALAYGCVPIVTNYRLIPTMVNTENGIFVKPKSPNQIAESIIELVHNPTKYNELSKNGINYFNSKFTADKYITQILEFFN